MKWLVGVLVLVLACGPGLRDTSQYRSPDLGDYAVQLEAASRAHDVARMRAMLHDEVTIGGIWFADVTCMRQFAAPGDVKGPRLDELARCIAGLELTRSARGDALPDVVVLAYGPGIELEARMIETKDGPWLAWIGYAARRSLQDALPTITPAALEQLRVAGDPQAPLAGPSTFDELAICKSAYAWLKVCIDATGAVSSTHVREATSPRGLPGYDRKLVDAIRAWAYKPYLDEGTPIPVCSSVNFIYRQRPGSVRIMHR